MLNHPHTLDVSIGTRVKANRLRAGWTQAQLAKASAIPQGLITLYENDQRVPSALKLAALAKAFEISMDNLVDREEIDIPSTESDDRRIHGNSTAALLQRIATQLDADHQKGLLHHARLLLTTQAAEHTEKTNTKRRPKAA